MIALERHRIRWLRVGHLIHNLRYLSFYPPVCVVLRNVRCYLCALALLLTTTLGPPIKPCREIIRRNGAVCVSLPCSNNYVYTKDPEARVPGRLDYQLPPSGQATVFARNGFIVDTMINGRGPFKAIFDTGSMNFMSARLATKLGLTVSIQSAPFGTATSAYLKARSVHIDSLTIGNLVVYNQTFHVADLPDASLPQLAFGYEMIQRFAVRIDHMKQRLTFYDSRHFHYRGSGKAVPLRFRDNYPLVEASLGLISGQFALDTGNELGLIIYSKFTSDNNLVRKLGSRFVGYSGRGYAGALPDAYLVRVNDFHIDSVRAPSVVAHLSTKLEGGSALAGNIGQSILNKFTEIFDFTHKEVFFERTSISNQPEIFNRAGVVLAYFGRGMQVMTVLPGSPAAMAGLRSGDVITDVKGGEVAFSQPPGTLIRLAVRRRGKTRGVTLHLKNVL